jgi:hypothetical protein
MLLGKIMCRTNLDSARFEEWPTKFTRVPMIGETVVGKSGRSLRVSGVTHSETKLGEPYVEVELHLFPGDTVAADIERYRRR